MLARIYHTHHKKYQEDLPFWKEITKGCDKILELGCGTGRVSIPLARAGSSVWGIDRDESALGVAHANLAKEPPRARERVSLIQADITNFRLNMSFGAAILPCNTYSTLTPGERKNVLEGVMTHLLPLGVFAVSVPNPVLLKLSKNQAEPAPSQESIFPHPQTGNPIQASSVQECAGDGAIWRWHYDHLLPTGKVERATLSTKHYYASTNDYEREFKEIGFNFLARYGDFMRSPYTSQSSYLILVAQKSA